MGGGDKILRQHVSSSNIQSIGYDPNSNTLEVAFQHGGIYQYYNVPEFIYNGIMSAGSKGSYLHQNIKGKYRYRKIG